MGTGSFTLFFKAYVETQRQMQGSLNTRMQKHLTFPSAAACTHS